MGSKTTFMLAFVVYSGVATWKWIKTCSDWPWPPIYISAGMVFALLSIFSAFEEELANASALGLSLAGVIYQITHTPNCNPSCGGTKNTTASATTGQSPQLQSMRLIQTIPSGSQGETLV